MNERRPFKYKKQELEEPPAIKVDEAPELIDPAIQQSEKLGVVIYKFPAKSNTFVVNELIELINNGVDVHIYSFDHPSKEDIEIFKDKMHYFEGKISYIISGGLFRWGDALKYDIAIGPNQVRTKWNEQYLEKDLYQVEQDAISRSFPIFEKLIDDMTARNIIKLYAPFSNLGCEIALMLSHHMSIPYYFSCHSHDLFCMFGYNRLKAERATGIFSISEFNKKFIMSEYGIPSEKIMVKRVNHLPDTGIPPMDLGHPYIFGAGRLIPMKGFNYSIRAFKKLRNKFPDLHYYIAGSGISEDEIKSLIFELGLEDYVHLIGHVDNNTVLSYIKGCSFTILSSITSDDGDMEGIPTFFIESMACGVPSIGTNYSGIPELIKNGKNGYLTMPKSIKDIAYKMSKLYKTLQSNKNDIYKNCIDTISQKFNNESNTNILLQEFAIKKKILIAGMPWTKDVEFDGLLPYGLKGIKSEYGNEFEFIFDIGKDTYGTNSGRTDIDLCLALHGNRQCNYMDDRFAYLDSFCDNVLSMHCSYLDGYIILDESGYKGGSTLADPDVKLNLLDVDERFASNYVDMLYDTRIKPYITDKKVDFDSYIIFAGQMPDDSSIACAFPEETTNLYAEYVIKSLARLNTLGIPIIYKTHPEMKKNPPKWAIIQETTITDLIKYGSFENVHLIDDIGINDMIKNCLCLISICSGSAFEALLHRKPVINIGRSDLKDFVYQIKEYDELLELDTVLSKFEDKPLDMYIYSFIKQYLQINTVDELYEALCSKIKK